MSDLDDLIAKGKDYSKFGFKKNPFSIRPLFNNYMDLDKCKEEKELFIVTEESEILYKIFDLDRRILLWGDIGVGKTTLINMILYISLSEKKWFPIRIIISEKNIGRTVQEILYSLCFEIMNELEALSISKPLKSLKNWILKQRSSDSLYEIMLKMMSNSFEEETVKKHKEPLDRKVKRTLKERVGFSIDEEVIKSLKTYVENSPPSIIKENLKSLGELVEKMGYGGIIFAIDEADHIEDMKSVVSALTTARDIFLASNKYTFIFCGSPELISYDRKKERFGIFDTEVHVKQLKDTQIGEILLRRIKKERNGDSVTLDSVFDNATLKTLYLNADGKIKIALKIAQNSLDEALYNKHDKIYEEDIKNTLGRMKATIETKLTETEMIVLQGLSEFGKPMSPSDVEFQIKTKSSRPTLQRTLSSLHRKGLVNITKEGKKTLYSPLFPTNE